MAGTLNDVYANNEEDDINALTQNAVAQNVKEYQVSPFEGGQFLFFGSGADKQGNFVNSVKYIRYNKNAAGVLALTARDIVAVQADPAIGTATFSLISLNQNIVLQVTGAAGINIGWSFKLIRVSVSMNNF